METTRLKIFTLVILIFFAVSVLFSGCGKSDSPEGALSEMQLALSERDLKKLSERVDLDKFFAHIYDDATIELVKNYEEYRIKYPNDPYFQHDAEFLKQYNAEHRDLHLKFLHDVLTAYFARIPEPDTPEENPYAYVANEFEKIRLASISKIKDTSVDKNQATMTLEIQGDSSLRGMFIGQFTFKLGFDKDDAGKWRLTKIENLDELTPPLVDKAELVWVTFF